MSFLKKTITRALLPIGLVAGIHTAAQSQTTTCYENDEVPPVQTAAIVRLTPLPILNLGAVDTTVARYTTGGASPCSFNALDFVDQDTFFVQVIPGCGFQNYYGSPDSSVTFSDIHADCSLGVFASI